MHSPIAQSVAYRTGGCWFDPLLGHYPFQGLMIVIAHDSFLSHNCPLFQQWLGGKAAKGLGRILCGVLVIKTQKMHG